MVNQFDYLNMKNQTEAISIYRKTDDQYLVRENLGIMCGCWLCLMDEVGGLSGIQ